MRTITIPLFTWLIIIVNVVIYVSLQQDMVLLKQPLSYVLIENGAMDPAHVWSGEVWRFVTGLFVHASFLHLVLNMFVLFQLGRLLETLIMVPRYILIFLTSGVVGFAASLLTHTTLAIGASAGIFGLVGALMVFVRVFPEKAFDKRLLRSLMIFVGINFAIGILINQYGLVPGTVDNVAHFAGFITGILLALALSKEVLMQWKMQKQADAIAKALSVSAFAAVFVLVIGSVGLALKPFHLPLYYLVKGQDALFTGRLADAKTATDELRALGPKAEAFADLLTARVAMQEKNEREARTFFSSALNKLATDKNQALEQALDTWSYSVGPHERLFADEKGNAALCRIALAETQVRDPLLLNDCAWLLLMARNKEVRDINLAMRWSKEAMQKQISTQILHTLAEVHAQRAEYKEAKAVLQRAILLSKTEEKAYLNEELKRLEKIEQKALL